MWSDLGIGFVCGMFAAIAIIKFLRYWLTDERDNHDDYE